MPQPTEREFRPGLRRGSGRHHARVLQRANIADLGNNYFQLTVYFGFKDRPDVMAALELCRVTVIASIQHRGMALWRERLFSTMARNASSAVEYFNLPAKIMDTAR